MNIFAAIDELLYTLEKGDVVAFPTETVFALAVDGTNIEAIEKLYNIKGRKKEKPFAIFLKNLNDIKKVAKLSKKQEIFIEYLIPESITFVLKKHSHPEKNIIPVATFNTAFNDTIAVRVPKHSLTLNLITRFARPIVATSANLSGMPPLNTVEEIKQLFNSVLVFENSPIHKRKNITNAYAPQPSTVVSLIDEELKILRNGAIDEGLLIELWEDIDSYLCSKQKHD